MKVKVNNDGIRLVGNDFGADVNVSVEWSAVFDLLYAAGEFVRFLLPGGYRKPLNLRRKKSKQA